MLYPEPNEYGTIEEFIFNANPYNEDINIADIIALQKFYQKNEYVPERYINLLLNYAIYVARRKVIRPPDSPINASFQYQCGPTAMIINDLMTKMGFKVEEFNVADVMNFEECGLHQLAVVHIPTIVDNKLVVKDYIMDPTFRQACIKRECGFERYFGEPRFGARLSTPFPGYFLNLTSEGKNFANNLITYGYFEMTDDNLKRYFDAFKLYLTPSSSYTHDTLGKVSSTNLTGTYYRYKVNQTAKDTKVFPEWQVRTPLEKEIENKKKVLYRIKDRLGLIQEEQSSLELEKEFTMK